MLAAAYLHAPMVHMFQSMAYALSARTHATHVRVPPATAQAAPMGLSCTAMPA